MPSSTLILGILLYRVVQLGSFNPSSLAVRSSVHAATRPAISAASRAGVRMGKKKKKRSKEAVQALAALESLERQRIRIVWFKSTDLRTHDQAALEAAHASDIPVLHLFVFEPLWYHASTPICGFPRTGARRVRFQLECLADLRKRLEAAGHSLSIVVPPKAGGKAAGSKWTAVDTFRQLCQKFDVESVYASQEVCQEELDLVNAVRHELVNAGANLQLFWTFEMYHKDDLPFDPSVRGMSSYSAFKRQVEERSSVRTPKLALDMSSTPPVHWDGFHDSPLPTLNDILPNAHGKVVDDSRAEIHWKGGETAALARLEEYLFGSDALGVEYVGATMTTNPAKSVLKDGALSKLSPWLAHGCISPRFIHSEVQRYERERRKGKSTYWILHELIWRDFSRFSSLHAGNSIFKIGGLENIKPSWMWSQDVKRFGLWQKGKTGFPFIDSFMRELEATGYCNHMGRETAGWFLIQDLGLDWRMGAEWFESTLLDYEPAANWFNWAYRCVPAARCKHTPGQSLSTLQVLFWAAQHDPEAKFIQRWLPELSPIAKAGGPLLALEPWRLRMQSEQGEEVIAARMAEERGMFNYGHEYPLPAISPVQVEGFDPKVVAAQALEAQRKQDAWARSTKGKLQSKNGAGLSPEPKIQHLGTARNHIEASQKQSAKSRPAGGQGRGGAHSRGGSQGRGAGGKARKANRENEEVVFEWNF